MFTPIDVQSDYSFLRSALTISKYVKTGKELGYEALVLADLDSMMSAVRFQNACLKHHIKPVFALSHHFYFEEMDDEMNGWFDGIFIALTERGYRQLLYLSTENNNQVYWKQVITMADWSKDLIFIFKLSNQTTLAYFKKQLAYMNQISHKDNPLYFGVNPYNLDDLNWDELDQLFEKHTHIEPIAIQTVRYIQPQNEIDLQVLQAIDRTDTIDITKKSNGNKFFPTKHVFKQLFSKHHLLKRALVANQELIKKTNYQIPIHQKLLPRFTDEYILSKQNHTQTTHEEIVYDYLKKICVQRMDELGLTTNNEYIKRLDKELEVINRMGFSDYFLIIWDVLKYARAQNIATSPGRGSAAGSLVSYLLQITGLDPIQYNLLFERFLNEERQTMPDIDLDFPDNRRDEIFKYVVGKYGKNHVAQIGSVGTFKARQALRDVGKVTGMDSSELNRLTSFIPRDPHVTLKDAYVQSRSFNQIINESATNQMIFEVAQRIEGMARHLTTHAAGIVITDQPLTDFTALYKRDNELLSLTQMHMEEIEQIGLLKMDFLSLRNLTIVDWVVRAINQHQSFAINDIPLNDQATFDLFKRANTDGVFQFESDGIKRVLRQVKPNSLEELSAVNALFRPGPMEQISLYVRRKFNQEAVRYVHPSLKPILKNTYGIMVYQEQVMQVTVQMADFSLAEADMLRRAMSKKIPQIIEEKKEAFIQGSLTNGFTRTEAEEVFHFIEQFANYGFNRSHAMAYSLLAYQMAYLKTHFPAEFYFALLQHVNLTSDKGKRYLFELREAGIKLLGPDINYSDFDAILEDNKIIMGLSAIKSLPKLVTKQLIAQRNRQGYYQNLEMILDVLDKKNQTEQILNILIESGALDSLNQTRHTLIATLPALIEQYQLFGSNHLLTETELGIAYKIKDEYSIIDRLEKEREYLNITVSPHPTEAFYRKFGMPQVTRLIEAKGSKKHFNTLLFIHEIKRVQRNNGEWMAFIKASDMTDTVEVILFSNNYYRLIAQIDREQVIYAKVRGNFSKEKVWQIILEDIYDLKHEQLKRKAHHQRLYINWTEEQGAKTSQLVELLKTHPGNTNVIFVKQPERKAFQIEEAKQVNINDQLLLDLKQLVGKENLVLKNND